MDDNTSLTWLLDQQAIRDRLLRYADGVDRCDWQTVAATFTDDAVVAGLLGERQIGPYLEFLQQSVEAYASTMHVFSNLLIDLEPGADTATTRTYATAYHTQTPDSRNEDLVVGVIYHDTLRKRDGEWRVAQRRTESKWIKGSLYSAD